MELPLGANITWQTVDVGANVTFKVPNDLEFVKKLGSSASGTLASFKKTDGRKIAVRRVRSDDFEDKRLLRDMWLMQVLKHENLLALVDVYAPEGPASNHFYIATDFMAADLQRVITSNQPLTEEHRQYFGCQILRGLRYLHGASVVHRDLRPSRLLVNANCDLRICGFDRACGVGRSWSDEDREHVVISWYKSPEGVCLASDSQPQVDIWAVGCILGELIGRRPLFRGRDHVHQLKQIFQMIGSPSEAELDWLPEGHPARKFLGKVTPRVRQPWCEVYPQACGAAHEVLEAMLSFHPGRRLDARRLLELPYFEDFSEQSLVINCYEADGCMVSATLSGGLVGTFPVPAGGEKFGAWLGDEVVKARPEFEGALHMIDPSGKAFLTRYVEEGSAPVKDPLDWDRWEEPSAGYFLQDYVSSRQLQAPSLDCGARQAAAESNGSDSPVTCQLT